MAGHLAEIAARAELSGRWSLDEREEEANLQARSRGHQSLRWVFETWPRPHFGRVKGYSEPMRKSAAGATAAKQRIPMHSRLRFGCGFAAGTAALMVRTS